MLNCINGLKVYLVHGSIGRSPDQGWTSDKPGVDCQRSFGCQVKVDKKFILDQVREIEVNVVVFFVVVVVVVVFLFIIFLFFVFLVVLFFFIVLFVLVFVGGNQMSA